MLTCRACIPYTTRSCVNQSSLVSTTGVAFLAFGGSGTARVSRRHFYELKVSRYCEIALVTSPGAHAASTKTALDETSIPHPQTCPSRLCGQCVATVGSRHTVFLRAPTLPPQHPPKSGIFQSLEEYGFGQRSFHPSQPDPPFEQTVQAEVSNSFSHYSSWRFTSFQSPSYLQSDPSIEQPV